jgi:protein-S-isoprenylcysteine O-methyltransferase Ste14
MGIGGSIFLLAVGAIIAFGVHVQLGWLDLSVVGWVLMLAGFVGLVLTLWFWNSRRRRVVVQPTEREVVRRTSEVVAEDNWAAPPPDRRV